MAIPTVNGTAARGRRYAVALVVVHEHAHEAGRDEQPEGHADGDERRPRRSQSVLPAIPPGYVRDRSRNVPATLLTVVRGMGCPAERFLVHVRIRPSVAADSHLG
jgi:hypothetical protein